MYLKARQSLLTDGSLVVILIITIVAVTSLYVSSEHTFYSSDYAGYQNITQSVVAGYRASLRSAIGAIVGSIEAEYNALFTIPLIPFVLFFGESRIVYEISLAVVYLLPFTLVVAAIAVQLIPVQPRAVFWSTVAVILLTPIAWVPTLRGYPDTGGALLICAGIWAYLRDSKLNHRWQILFIGLATASSMLFRRHFAYAAIALFAAMVLHTLVRFAGQFRQKPRPSFQDLTTSSLRLGFTALVTLLALLVIGRSFLYRGLTTNYIALYAAYMEPPLAVLEWYAAAYGWAALAAAALGIIIGVRSGIVNRQAAAFIVIFTGFSLLEWLLVVRQPGEQYTMHFTPIVALGLVALVSTILFRLNSSTRAIALCGFFLYMGTNMVIGLTRLELLTERPIRSLFARKESPLRRNDVPEVARLVSYLREVAAHNEHIYVAASSAILTRSLLSTAERALYGWNSARLKFLFAPQIDSRDSWPLEMMLQAQYVVVAHPVQHHLGVEKQRVVKVVYDLFTDSQAMAQDFVRLPKTFLLEEGTVVSIYQRTRPTSLKTALGTLRFMENNLQSRPGGQLDWMVISQTYSYSVKKDRDNGYWVTTHLSSNSTPSSTTLLYLGEMPDTVVALTGMLAFRGGRCAGATLHLAKVNSRDEITNITDVLHRRKSDSEFALTFPKQDAINVLLTVTSINEPASIDDCAVEIEKLKLVGRSTSGFIDNQSNKGVPIHSEARNRRVPGL
jgi:hypothetical protein